MKFTIAAFLAAFTTACFAQSVEIDSPANNTSVSPGSSIVVEVVRPVTLSPSSIEVAIVIGIGSCGTAGCPAPGVDLGTILFNGPYDPQPHQTGPHEPLQNFTVTIPPTIAQGPAQLSVFHVALIGLDPQPFTETLAINLNVD